MESHSVHHAQPVDRGGAWLQPKDSLHTARERLLHFPAHEPHCSTRNDLLGLNATLMTTPGHHVQRILENIWKKNPVSQLKIQMSLYFLFKSPFFQSKWHYDVNTLNVSSSLLVSQSKITKTRFDLMTILRKQVIKKRDYKKDVVRLPPGRSGFTLLSPDGRQNRKHVKPQ